MCLETLTFYRFRKGRHVGQVQNVTESIEIWEDQFEV